MENQNVDSYHTDNDQGISNEKDFLDKLLGDIDKIDDLEAIDDVYNKLELEILKKTKMLKNIHKENSEIKNDLDSKRNFLSELDGKSCEVQQKTENLREMIDDENNKLKALRTHQSNNLIQFENDVEKICEKFTSGPHEYASNSLSAVLRELQGHLQANVAVLSSQLEERLALQQTSNHTDSTDYELALKLHEEELSALNISIVNLTTTEEQLKKKVHLKTLLSATE